MYALTPTSAAGAGSAVARSAAPAAADVHYAVLDAPVGRLVAAATSRGIARLAYEDDGGGVDAILGLLATRLSPRIIEAPSRLDDVRRQLAEYFEARRRDFDIAIDWALVGPFGRRVLRATAAIPFGETRTYTDVAAAAGSPNGSRAAGNALGANPVPIIVPCHRVLRTGGSLGGYTGGLPRKRLLLETEASAAS